MLKKDIKTMLLKSLNNSVELEKGNIVIKL